MPKKIKLDTYESEIEENFENRIKIPNQASLNEQLKIAAKHHLSNKKPDRMTFTRSGFLLRFKILSFQFPESTNRWFYRFLNRVKIIR
jgi:hypothetical protein